MASKRKDPLYEKGLKTRAAVLGAEHVKRRTQTTNKYAQPFEEFTTKAAWGLIWSRPGLTRKQLHTAVYCVIPRCTEARRAMLEVFAEEDEAKR